MKNSKLIITSILCVCYLMSCDTTKKEWQTAQQANSLEGYKIFIKNYPSSTYLEQAQSQLDSLLTNEAFKIANVNNSKLNKLTNGNVNQINQDLNKRDVEDLLKVLVAKYNLLLDTTNYICDIELATGKDWNKFKNSSGMSMGGSTSRSDKNGKEYFVTRSGLMLDETRLLSSSVSIGTGKYLSGLKYSKINLTASYSIEETSKHIIYSTYYSNDKLYFSISLPGVSDGGIRTPFAKNTIIRIVGNSMNFFKEVNIHSDMKNPIHVLLTEKGLFYLLGKGEIKVSNNKVLSFK